MKILSKTIAYATMKKKRVNKKEIDLEKDIQKLEKSDKSQEDCMIMNGKKAELKAIREKRIEGVLLRSKARGIAHGEKVTSYFCSLEKRHYISKNMAKLTDKDDNILTDNNDILQEVNNFYEKLYERRDVEDCEISQMVTEIPHLNDEEAERIEGEVTLNEASMALRNMKHSKSPGTDGFNAEFFKVFWSKIELVVRALNWGFRKGELSCTQREGIITCIPKGDKRRVLIKNWRPISLLNVVYKIGSAAIADRIKTMLPELINEDQTGFMSGRYIGDNLRLIYDMIAYLKEKNLPGLLLNIDFEKAFDSVDWKFMFKVLKAFGFKQDICRLDRNVLYKH